MTKSDGDEKWSMQRTLCFDYTPRHTSILLTCSSLICPFPARNALEIIALIFRGARIL
ncbi:unnamed protein product [Chondrus crispus]|uniref:Uncharacterized protein n=1 Tax=Chondrus crispus TaxID=2769 RepID=R7QB78_CHOCR|nr:unnamed protein product [Chondrus crispus]CDF34725.1 unnamed protein product [Chondrus crispus]|eukprot:XP_005714544.1 unnamed protein product [Chondrus crispus]